jgi:AraC-like DNA-binding protein
MTVETQSYGVRAQFSHIVAEACQRFAGAVLIAEPLAFVTAMTQLVADLPRPENPLEALLMWTSSREVTARGAQAHHAWFHDHLARTPCGFRPPPLPSPDTFVIEKTFLLLNDWAAAYARAFDALHEWPAAVRAARVLQANHACDWYVEDLARTVNVSLATLERSFSRTYGVTARQYHSLLRLRAVAQSTRASAGCIEGMILEAGCRSHKAVYGPFRRLTGLTPADVRRLSDNEFCSLMSGPLALPIAGGRSVGSSPG